MRYFDGVRWKDSSVGSSVLSLIGFLVSSDKILVPNELYKMLG
jgi:hypothetical protein